MPPMTPSDLGQRPSTKLRSLLSSGSCANVDRRAACKRYSGEGCSDYNGMSGAREMFSEMASALLNRAGGQFQRL
eukprot:11700782-Prorocentrum_lima.AAC.1